MYKVFIEKLMLWNQINGWVKYHSKSESLILSLHFDQLLVTDGPTILESFSLAGKLKGFCKNNVLILIVLTEDNKMRKIKFQLKAEALSCIETLRKNIPITGECDGKIFGDTISCLSMEHVIKNALENCKMEDLNAKETTSSSDNFIKLCLLDPMFPQYVHETQKILEKIQK